MREERQRVFSNEMEFDEERNQFLLDKARWKEESNNKDGIIKSLEARVGKLEEEVETWKRKSLFD